MAKNDLANVVDRNDGKEGLSFPAARSLAHLYHTLDSACAHMSEGEVRALGGSPHGDS